MQFSQNSDGFRQTIHKAFRTHCINEIPFQFHYLPKLYIGFNFEVNMKFIRRCVNATIMRESELRHGEICDMKGLLHCYSASYFMLKVKVSYNPYFSENRFISCWK